MRLFLEIVGGLVLIGLAIGLFVALQNNPPSGNDPTVGKTATSATTPAAATPAAPPVNSTVTHTIPPVEIRVVHSEMRPTTPLPTTDREPTRLTAEPAYQYDYANQPPMRLVPYPGAPYVPPVRPYDPNETRYQRTDVLLEGENGVLIPVVEERALTSPAPVLLHQKRPVSTPPPATPPAAQPSPPTPPSTSAVPAPTAEAPPVPSPLPPAENLPAAVPSAPDAATKSD